MKFLSFKSVKGSTLARCVGILSVRERQKFLVISVIQVALSALDLLGVALLGILGALAISGVESHSPGNRVSGAIRFFGMNHLHLQSQALLLAILAGIALTTRTILSIFFTRRTLFFLSHRGSNISSKLLKQVLSMPLEFIQTRTVQETVFALTAGVETITLRVLGSAATMIADASLLIVMSMGLFFVDPIIAMTSMILFAILGLVLYFTLNNKAKFLGIESSGLEIKSAELISEVLSSYRESVVRNRRGYYAAVISDTRLNLSNLLAEISFLPFISKYILESAIVLGGLTIGAIQFASHDAVHAVATLTIFMATGSRIGPAVLRIQQGAIQIKGSLGTSKPTLDLIDEIYGNPVPLEVAPSLSFDYPGFDPTLRIIDLSFRYRGSTSYAILDLNLSISKCESVAIVGASGAGKTTLVDLILGILETEKGSVSISNCRPLEAIRKWPGAISYVPQDILITNATIRENVLVGYPNTEVEDSRVWDALTLANLDGFVKSLPDGLDTNVGERGSRLSGGQRQRLGIARALFTKPKLIILDEATSALDGQSEDAITSTISALKQNATIIVIAHRLSTIKNSDRIIFLDSGKIIGEGDFDFLRNEIEAFDKQARLMGF